MNERERISEIVDRHFREHAEKQAALAAFQKQEAERVRAARAQAIEDSIRKSVNEILADERAILADFIRRRDAKKRAAAIEKEAAAREAEQAVRMAELEKERVAALKEEAAIYAEAMKAAGIGPGTVHLGEGAVKVTINEADAEPYDLEPDEDA
jgi:hypothetical protein